jgi:hypothetical protein
LRLRVRPERLALVRLAPIEPLPTGLFAAPFFSITRTPDEFSLVVPVENLLAEWQSEIGWRALQVVGPLDFALTGILAGLAQPLAEAKISIFALSTFETDYLLVKEAYLPAAVDVLTGQGYVIEGTT